MTEHSKQIEGAAGAGRWAADMFIQSLHDYGEAMTHEEAGDAFAETVFEEMRKTAESNWVASAQQFHAFLARIGEVLWMMAEKERMERCAVSADHAAGKQVAQVIQLAIEATAKKGGAQ